MQYISLDFGFKDPTVITYVDTKNHSVRSEQYNLSDYGGSTHKVLLKFLKDFRIPLVTTIYMDRSYPENIHSLRNEGYIVNPKNDSKWQKTQAFFSDLRDLSRRVKHLEEVNKDIDKHNS